MYYAHCDFRWTEVKGKNAKPLEHSRKYKRFTSVNVWWPKCELFMKMYEKKYPVKNILLTLTFDLIQAKLDKLDENEVVAKVRTVSVHPPQD